MLPLALISVYVYKLALQPAIHAFYEPVPDMLMAYGLVVIAAMVYGMLLGSVVLRFYPNTTKLISGLMGFAMLLYVIQMAWFSPISHMIFWSMVWLVGMLGWILAVWALQRFAFEPALENADTQMTKPSSLSGYAIKGRH